MVAWPWCSLVALGPCSRGGMAVAWLGGTEPVSFLWDGRGMAWWRWDHVLMVAWPWLGWVALRPHPHDDMTVSWPGGTEAVHGGKAVAWPGGSGTTSSRWHGLVALVLCSHGDMAMTWPGGSGPSSRWHGHGMAGWH